MLSQHRVVVTELGIICPVGLTVPEAWNNVVAGVSGIRPITEFDVSEFPVRFGGTIEGFDVSSYVSKKDARRMERFIHYGVAAGAQAIRDAGLEITEQNAERIGASIGSGIGGLRGIEKNYDAFLKGGPRKISPLFVPANIINMIAGNLSITYDLKGPNIAMVTACTSGTHSIGEAARIIAYGDADAMLAGGAEMATTHTGLGGFAAAKALSTRNDDPLTASRP